MPQTVQTITINHHDHFVMARPPKLQLTMPRSLIDPRLGHPSAARSESCRRHGFSLVEALVVLAILFILLAISIPFVRDMRSLTRRSNCDQNLIRLALATQAYTSDFGHLPSGTFSFNASVDLTEQPQILRCLPEGYHQNWISSLLPYLDRQGLYQSIRYEYGVYTDANRLAREVDIAFLRCPAATETQLPNTTSYVGMHASESTPIAQDNSGLLMLNRWIGADDVGDGMAYTILLGEKISPPEYDLGWMSGTRSSLRNAGTPINAKVPIETYRDPLFVGGLASHHAGGVTVAMGDSAIKFLSESIEASVYQNMVGRNDQAEAQVP